MDRYKNLGLFHRDCLEKKVFSDIFLTCLLKVLTYDEYKKIYGGVQSGMDYVKLGRRKLTKFTDSD